jgi:hypothetical protein
LKHLFELRIIFLEKNYTNNLARKRRTDREK